jgi:hypothetical protein
LEGQTRQKKPKKPTTTTTTTHEAMKRKFYQELVTLSSAEFTRDRSAILQLSNTAIDVNRDIEGSSAVAKHTNRVHS